jgi:hypothetical protein
MTMVQLEQVTVEDVLAAAEVGTVFAAGVEALDDHAGIELDHPLDTAGAMLDWRTGDAAAPRTPLLVVLSPALVEALAGDERMARLVAEGAAVGIRVATMG